MLLKRLFLLFAFSAVILFFTEFVGCVATAEPVSYYRPTVQNKENLTVDEWIARGDVFYFKDDYGNARENGATVSDTILGKSLLAYAEGFSDISMRTKVRRTKARRSLK